MSRVSHHTCRTVPLGLTVLVAVACLVGLHPSQAAAAGPLWSVQSVASPTNFTTARNEKCAEEEGCDEYIVTATNVGSGPSSGPVIVKDILPPGMLTVRHPGGRHFEYPATEGWEALPCVPPSPTAEVTCESVEPVRPGGFIQIYIEVRLTGEVEPEALNRVEVEEVGGAQGPVRSSYPTTVANTVDQSEAGFGAQDFAVEAHGQGAGLLAGGHPDSLTATINLNTVINNGGRQGGRAAEEPKSEIVDLPLGLVGDPLAASQCSESTLYGRGQPRSCPSSSRVGSIVLQNAQENQVYPVYNVVPEPGYPAMFAFEIAETVVLMPTRVVPSRDGYMLSVAVPAIPRTLVVRLTGISLTLFGVPGAQNGSQDQTALLTNPVNCSSGPLNARLETDSWVNPTHWVTSEATVYEANPAAAILGCGNLQFNPSLAVEGSAQADSPAPLDLHLNVPQVAPVESVQATPPVRDIDLQLPEGLTVSPSAADGLRACPATGPEGIELGNLDGPSHEAHAGEVIGEDGVPHAAPGHCPAASEIGTVEAVTPVLAAPLTGHLFLAEPECGTSSAPAPCTAADVESGKVFRVYAELEGSGVNVKVPGTTTADATTGRLTVHFDEDPQFPFSDLRVHLNGGPKAPLASPQACGPATIGGTLTPWSAPQSGPPAQVTASLPVSGCPSAASFAPTVLAHASLTSATARPSFTFAVSRKDGEPYLTGTGVGLPLGLLADIGAVTPCSNAAADAASCGAASAIGKVQAALGVGPSPFRQTGTVYLTEGYKGAPFGLAIVLPTTAGPFTLAGNTGKGLEVVRATVSVDPTTAAVSIASDPLPQVIDGVPIRLRDVDVTVDRSGFMVNPSNCRQQAVSATIDGVGPISEKVKRPFAVTGCKGLPFKPALKLSFSGGTKRTGNPAIKAVLTQPKGETANIAGTTVILPKGELIDQAHISGPCTRVQFAEGAVPGERCPKGSILGTAKAYTPLLSRPLKGKVYFRSNGGERELPDLVVALRGEVELQLVGFIDSVGRKSAEIRRVRTRFQSVPDAPVSRFELRLAGGKRGLIENNKDLCKAKERAKLQLTGQNGKTYDTQPKVRLACGRSTKHS